MYNSIKWFSTLVMLIFLFGISCYAQSSEKIGQLKRNNISEEAYEKALDEIFPRVELENNDNFVTFVLRYEPSTETEMQLVIFQKGSDVVIVKYTAVESIYKKLNEDQTHNDLNTIVQQVKIRKEEIKGNVADFSKWHREFFKYFNKSFKTLNQELELYNKTREETILLDSARYKVWFNHGIKKFYISYYDVELDERKIKDPDFMLTRWIFNIFKLTAHRSRN